MRLSDMEVRHFGAECRDCGGHFTIPLLSDFSYGEFIFHAKGIAGYLNTFETPAWADVEARLQRLSLLPEKPASEEITRLHRVIAAAADRLGGQSLHPFPSCHHCGSLAVDYGTGSPGGFHRMPLVTFEQYLALDERDRDRRLARLWHELA